MFAGLRRTPGPAIGTLVAAATAATIAVAALGVAGSRPPSPLGRLAGADVVVAADTQLLVTVGRGENAQRESVPLSAYAGVPAALAGRLARVPGVASAAGESGFPGGTVRPGMVDVIAVVADRGTSPAALAARIEAGLPRDSGYGGSEHGGTGYTVATGTARAGLADLNAAVQSANGHALGYAVIPALITTALFALVATASLAVGLRRRRFALLRAVGATRGQIRRAVLAEQAVLAVAGALIGFLPGTALGVLAVGALGAHGLLPAGSTAWSSPWQILLACAVTVPACLVSGMVAAQRAARTSPARAVRSTHAERRWPSPVRVLLGLAAAGGVVTLNVLALHQNGPGAQVALALPSLVCGMVAVALLGPALVSVVAMAARPLAAGPSAGLALAAIRRMPARTGSAVVSVALAVGLIGAVAFSNTSIAHATAVQSTQAVTADHVLSGGGLTTATLPPSMLTGAGRLPGVRAAVGVAALSVGVTDPGLEFINGESVSAGPVSDVLDLHVTAGRLSALGPGQIAVSTMEASNGPGVRLGQQVTVYLPDGTPYRATVSALYQRSLAVGDLLIPASVAAGHTGTPAEYGQILVSGGTQRELAALAAAHPGTRVASRAVYNSEVASNAQQNSYVNLLILGIIIVLTAVTMVNTLVVSTVERRRQVRLLGRVGATRAQLAAAFCWQALFVTVVGVAAGAAVCVGTLIGLTRAATGSAVPFIPTGPAVLVVGAVAALAFAATLTPFAVISREKLPQPMPA
jgi:putative ABC transport system permease protein